MKQLAPSFLEEINVVWIKCLLRAAKEGYTAVSYGFMFCRGANLPGLSPRSPAKRSLSPGHGWRCRPRAPSQGWMQGAEPWSRQGSKRPHCRAAERQEWRRKMKTQKRSVSELEMEALACCAVPKKARQPEIDVLLPNERARMETPGARLPLTRGAAAANTTNVAV